MVNADACDNEIIDDEETDENDTVDGLLTNYNVYEKNLFLLQERDFCPELFGLLDNPGVLRFEEVDYPLEVVAQIKEMKNSLDDSDILLNQTSDSLNDCKDICCVCLD